MIHMPTRVIFERKYVVLTKSFDRMRLPFLSSFLLLRILYFLSGTNTFASYVTVPARFVESLVDKFSAQFPGVNLKLSS